MDYYLLLQTYYNIMYYCYFILLRMIVYYVIIYINVFITFKIYCLFSFTWCVYIIVAILILCVYFLFKLNYSMQQ